MVTFAIGPRSYTLEVEEEHTEGYDRDDWNHWIEVDNSDFTVRDRILQEESLIPVTIEKSSSGEIVSSADYGCAPSLETF